MRLARPAARTMKGSPWASKRSVLWGLALTLSTLPACTGYQLRGKVVEGAVSGILIVDEDNDRLAEPGLAGAVIEVTIDPASLGREHLPCGFADHGGWFRVPVEMIGAGLLENDVAVVVRLAGHEPAVRTMRLPGAHKRLLVMLSAGRDTVKHWRDHILDETLRISEPYLRGP